MATPLQRRLKADSICIIGAGPSGLAAAKYLLAERTFSRITIYERRSTVGGIWNFVPCNPTLPEDISVPQTNPNIEIDKPVDGKNNLAKSSGEHQEDVTFLTPLYDRLETNIPRSIMGFSDLDWPKHVPLFPRHAEVMDYIEEYAKDVRHLITFDTQVIDVAAANGEKWNVTTRHVSKENGKPALVETFDAVVVASGHFDVPYIPPVLGVEAWNTSHPGRITHSKFFRKPEDFAGKKVIVVGNSASGIDIGEQISQYYKGPMILSSKSESFLVSEPSPHKTEKPQITDFLTGQRGVRFADGSVESDIDAIVYCTGYLYSYPFLQSLDPPVISTGKRVQNLYQHVFYRKHPTLSFLALNQKVLPFPLAEAQSAVIARVYSGRLALPAQSDMAKWEQDIIADAERISDFHALKVPADLDYSNMLHDWAVSADGEGTPGIGKTPQRFDEEAYWLRERIPRIKRAYQDLGEERLQKRTLEDVGYCFEEWKREQMLEDVQTGVSQARTGDRPPSVAAMASLRSWLRI